MANSKKKKKKEKNPKPKKPHLVCFNQNTATMHENCNM